MKNEAKNLAKALIISGDGEFVQEYILNSTDEVIVVVAVKARSDDITKEMNKAIKRFIPSASGKPCPKCSGTGRV